MSRRDLTFRVFVSSTFSDLIDERNALQEHAFPRLRAYCQEKGARFQAIDLRWGVSEEAALDQQTMNICLQELRRCQKVSPRPNFIVLLGDRYGWRPLPPQIDGEELEQLLKVMTLEEQTAVSKWYRRDDNAVPSEYVLQPRTGEFEDLRRWDKEEAFLHDILLQTAHSVLPPNDEALNKYQDSATHQEIRYGALQAEDPQTHVFAYFRTIEGLPEDSSAKDYRDIKDGTIDREVQDRLLTLKWKLQSLLPPEHVYEYRAEWHEGRPHSDLQVLCERVEGDLRAIIDRELAAFQQASELDREIEAHKEFGQQRSEHFIGREEILRKIQTYLMGDSNRPLVVHGISGSGKTALMAKAAEAIANCRMRNAESTVISRFIGATPGSSDIRALLESLWRQIARAYGDERPVPGDYRELTQDFPKRLALATAERPMVVLLDALDQLSPTDGARYLSWLPRELPAHVKLIVSVLEVQSSKLEVQSLDSEVERSGGDCYQIIQKLAPAENLMRIDALTAQQGENLLDAWLDEARRRLQPAQRQKVLSKFAVEGLPLYLKLAFGEAQRWKSYDTPLPLSGDVPGIVTDMLVRLEDERNHGRVVTSRVLGYLAAGRHGLTEEELLDVLSADEEVLADFRRRSPQSPAVERLPVVIWSRLHADLEPYLTERRADNTTVLNFYHRQVGEAVAKRYLDGDDKLRAHRLLANYFRRKGDPQDDGSWKGSYPRGLSESPYHLAQSGQGKELEQTLTCSAFLDARLKAFNIEALIADYDWANLACLGLTEESVRALDLIQGALRLSAPVLVKGKSQLASHLTGRLLGFRLPGIRRLLEQIRDYKKEPWLRPLTLLTPPGGPLVRTLEGHSNDVRAVAMTNDGRWGVSGSVDKTLKVWELETGVCLRTLEGHSDEVNAVVVTANGRQAISGSCDSTLKVWDLETGECLRTLKGHRGDVRAVAITPDGRHVVSASEDKTLKVWDLNTGVCLRTLQGHEEAVNAVLVTLEGLGVISGSSDGTLKVWDLASGTCSKTIEADPTGINGLAVGQDGTCALSAAGKDILVLNLLTGELPHRLKGHSDFVVSLAIAADGRVAISGSSDNTVRIWDLHKGNLVQTLRGHSGYVNAVTITPDGNRVVSGGDDHTVKVWRVDRPLVGTLQGHTGAVTSLAFALNGTQLVSGSDDGSIRIWNLSTNECIAVLKGHRGSVAAIAVSPDGNRLVSGGEDKTVRVWDYATGACIFTLEAHRRGVKHVALSRDGLFVFSANDSEIKVWNVREGRCFSTLRGNALTHSGFNGVQNSSMAGAMRGLAAFFLDSAEGFVKAIAVTNDDQFLIAACSSSLADSPTSRLKFWNWRTGACVATVDIDESELIVAFALTPDGQRAVTAYGGLSCAKVQDILSGDIRAELYGHTGDIEVIAVVPSTGFAVTGSKDGAIRLWNLDTSVCLNTFDGRTGTIRAIAVSAREQLMASASWFDDRIWLWNLTCAQQMVPLKHPTENEIAMSPKSQYAVTAGHGILKVWDYTTGACLRTISGEVKFRKPFHVEVYREFDHIDAIVMCPDGRRIILVSNQFARVLDLESGLYEEKGLCGRNLEFGNYRVTAMTISPDGRTLFTGSDDTTVKIWDVESGEYIGTLSGHGAAICSLAVTPNGRCLLSGNHDSSVRVWDIAFKKCVQTLNGRFTFRVLSAADGALAITSSEEKGAPIQVWDIRSGACISFIDWTKKGERVTCWALDPEDEMLVIGGSDKSLRGFDLHTGSQIASFIAENELMSCGVGAAHHIAASDKIGQVYFLRLEHAAISYRRATTQRE